MRTIAYAIATMVLCFGLGFFMTCDKHGTTTHTIQTKFEPEQYVYAIYHHTHQITFQTGTAFKVKYRGRMFLMSVSHVCTGINPLVKTGNTLESTRIIATDPYLDLCILEIPKSIRHDKNALKISRLTLKENEQLSTIGFPGGRNFKILAHGKYNGRRPVDWPGSDIHGRLLDFIEYITIPGQSGSPVFNDQGLVVGVIQIRAYDEGGFIPIGSVTEFLDENISG